MGGIIARSEPTPRPPVASTAVNVHELATPALLVDLPSFEHNVATMTAARPGSALRPHVKAFKSTALAARLADAGHQGFCCATTREMVGMATAGLGHDLLLANEVVDPRHLATLAALDRDGTARVTVAVDSDATIEAAAAAGIREVLIDVNVGLPRCGCRPDDAGRLGDLARASGLAVRGVMGYEGHVVGIADRETRERRTGRAMGHLIAAHEAVGGEVISGGGTGTYDCNPWVTELQAGSYVLMDTHYDRLGLPFRQGLILWTTVISVSHGGAVCDGGLKSLGMDHGDPTIEGATVLVCSDEHITFVPDDGWTPTVGDRVGVLPAHIDPTVALHEALWVVDGDEVVDRWPVDLRGW
jgi:D-serine deaminase-like pyridoxal phosphate-dependent protein